MKVLGGVGSKNGHRPVHVADIRPGGVVDRCCDIQVGCLCFNDSALRIMLMMY